ncbi:MAG TPA: MurR/RpiR family transcriptional regulator [Burkholderiaceae bacterium]|nr:MurR/RpiR family transcriptional regulator [Burkholderiaceae bacterium]
MKRASPIDFMLSNAAITERIAKTYPSLTSAHRKAADYVLANPFQAATMTIDELADAVGMSVATANRFARALQFDGYPQFRAELVKAFETTLAPVEKLRTELAREASSVETFAASLEEDLENIQGTLHQLNAAACEKAVDMILCAPRVFILGFSTSAYLGSILAHRLDPCCPIVQTIANDAGPTQAARRLFKLNKEDLVIAICFPRYNKFTVELLGLARDRHAKVLALTDSATSPLVPLADIVLYAKANRRLSANSEAAALALIEALCGAVVHRSKNSLRNATELTERLLPYLYTCQQTAESGASAPRKKKARK